MESVFPGDMCGGKNTAQAARVEIRDPNEAQRSGFVWERRGKGAQRSFRRQAETEWSGLCPDDVAACISSKKCLHF